MSIVISIGLLRSRCSRLSHRRCRTEKLVLFDDWFHYKGNPNKGGPRVPGILEGHSKGSVQYRPYGTFGNSFIVYKK